MSSDVVGCAQLYLLDTSAEIQLPSAKLRLWAVLEGMPGHAPSKEQSHGWAREALLDVSISSTC